MGEVKPLKRRSQVFDMHFMTENIVRRRAENVMIEDDEIAQVARNEFEEGEHTLFNGLNTVIFGPHPTLEVFQKIKEQDSIRSANKSPRTSNESEKSNRSQTIKHVRISELSYNRQDTMETSYSSEYDPRKNPYCRIPPEQSYSPTALSGLTGNHSFAESNVTEAESTRPKALPSCRDNVHQVLHLKLFHTFQTVLLSLLLILLICRFVFVRLEIETFPGGSGLNRTNTFSNAFSADIPINREST